VPKPGPPPVITKIRLKSALNAVIRLITKVNCTNRFSSGKVIRTIVVKELAPSTLAAS
jgi:hypothetical protein